MEISFDFKTVYTDAELFKRFKKLFGMKWSKEQQLHENRKRTMFAEKVDIDKYIIKTTDTAWLKYAKRGGL